MMAMQRWLLIQLIQEAAEVQKEATKILLFGETATDGDGNEYDNRKALENELNDLEASRIMLNQSGVIISRSQHSIDRKIEKIKKHAHAQIIGEVFR